jgi:hypothetical protein
MPNGWDPALLKQQDEAIYRELFLDRFEHDA